MDENNAERGYNLYWQNGLIHFQLMHHVPEDMITLVSKSPAPANQWHHVVATYDGSGKAAGAKVYLDGKPLQSDPTRLVLASHQEIAVVIGKPPAGIPARYQFPAGE